MGFSYDILVGTDLEPKKLLEEFLRARGVELDIYIDTNAKVLLHAADERDISYGARRLDSDSYGIKNAREQYGLSVNSRISLDLRYIDDESDPFMVIFMATLAFAQRIDGDFLLRYQGEYPHIIRRRGRLFVNVDPEDWGKHPIPPLPEGCARVVLSYDDPLPDNPVTV